MLLAVLPIMHPIVARPEQPAKKYNTETEEHHYDDDKGEGIDEPAKSIGHRLPSVVDAVSRIANAMGYSTDAANERMFNATEGIAGRPYRPS